MKNKTLLLLLLLISSTCFAKKIKARVTFNNLTGEKIKVSLNVGKNVVDPAAYEYRGKEMLSTEYSWTFETDKDIENYSVIFGSAIILKNGIPAGKITGKPIVISKGGIQNYSWDIELKQSNKRSLDDLSSQILQYNPNLFLNEEISPKPISGLFNQYLGALQAFRVKNDDTIFEFRIAPVDMKLALKIGEVKGTQTSNQSIEFANLIDQKVKATIPAITELGLNFSYDRMHSIKLEYKDIGVVDWIKTSGMKEKPTSDIYKEDIALLDQIELGKLYFKYGDSLKLRRIDKAYIFDGIYLEHVEGTSINGGNEIDISTFVTNSGTFEFKNSMKTSKIFGSSYLGYWISNTSPNFDGLLEYFKAVYVARISDVLDTDEQLKEEYEELRKVNPELPELKNKYEIKSYYKRLLQNYLKDNPQERAYFNSENQNIKNEENFTDNLSDGEVQLLMENANEKFEFIPDNLNLEDSKKMLNKLNQIDPNIGNKLKISDQQLINNNY